MKNFLIVLVLGLNLPSLVYAGNRAHGGDYIRCHDPDSDEDVYWSKDYFKARYDPSALKYYVETLGLRPNINFIHDLVEPGDSIKSLAKKVILRLKYFSLVRFRTFSDWINTFEDEAYIGRVLSPEIEHDEALMIIPEDFLYENCEDGQLTWQLKDPESANGEYRYYIQKAILEKLNLVNKATNLIHEIVYRESLSSGNSQAKSTIELTMLLITGALPDFNLAETLEAAKENSERTKVYQKVFRRLNVPTPVEAGFDRFGNALDRNPFDNPGPALGDYTILEPNPVFRMKNNEFVYKGGRIRSAKFFPKSALIAELDSPSTDNGVINLSSFCSLEMQQEGGLYYDVRFFRDQSISTVWLKSTYSFSPWHGRFRGCGVLDSIELPRVRFFMEMYPDDKGISCVNFKKPQLVEGRVVKAIIYSKTNEPDIYSRDLNANCANSENLSIEWHDW